MDAFVYRPVNSSPFNLGLSVVFKVYTLCPKKNYTAQPPSIILTVVVQFR